MEKRILSVCTLTMMIMKMMTKTQPRQIRNSLYSWCDDDEDDVDWDDDDDRVKRRNY